MMEIALVIIPMVLQGMESMVLQKCAFKKCKNEQNVYHSFLIVSEEHRWGSMVLQKNFRNARFSARSSPCSIFMLLLLA
jgi:hypothetical protein